MTGIGGHHSAKPKSVDWITPRETHEQVGGPLSFDLDPCASTKQPWPMARQSYTIVDNGLIQPWFGRVWLNPPYSTGIIGRFLARMAEHGRGTALIFARTETDAFFDYVWDRATALLFMRTPRLHFHHPDGRRAKHNCGAPTVLCAYGFDDAEILHDCSIEGQFVPLALPRFVVAAVIDQTWLEVVVDAMGEGPVEVTDLYERIAGHIKTKGNQHWRAKARQTLGRGPFKRVGRGVWEMEGAAS